MNISEYFDEEGYSANHKQALFVHRPPRLIVKDTVPADGNEFIFKSRIENASLQFPKWETKEEKKSGNQEKSSNPDKVNYNKWVADRFYPLTQQVKLNRKMLVNKFKQTETIPLSDEEDCCKFCLGSEISSEIYENAKSQPSEKPHVPLLSYVIHLQNSDIIKLLDHLKKWCSKVGFKEEICLWTFVLLICLTRPLKEDDEDVLEDIYDYIQIRMKNCEEDELCRLELISTILYQSYCVKAYTLSPNFMF